MTNATAVARYLHFAPWKTALPDGVQSDMHVVVDRTTGLIVHVADPGDVNAWLAAKKQLGHQAEIVQCNFLMPGLTDAHTHPLLYPMLRVMNAISCQGMDRQDVVKTIKQACRKFADQNQPLLFTNMETAKVTGMTASELDKLTGDRDVIITDASLHGGVVSSTLAAKLSLALTNKTGLGGYLNNDGTLTETYVLEALTLMQQSYPSEVFEQQMERDLQRYFSIGVTSIHDLLPLNVNSFYAALNVRKRWREQNKSDFPITRFYLRPEHLRALALNLPDLLNDGLLDENDLRDHIGMKLFADGSFGSHTALVSEEYNDHHGYGISYDTMEQMLSGLQLAVAHQLKTVAVHAIGDAGINCALEIARAWRKNRTETISDSRFRIEHFELPTEKILNETKALGCWVVPQPNFLLDVCFADRLGDRVDAICPHQKILDLGIPTMFGSDGMPESMLYSIYLATHARNKSQRISLAQAIEISAGTAAKFEGDNRGAIAPGMKADLVIADKELYTQILEGEPDIPEIAGVADAMATRLDGMVKAAYKNGREVYMRA